MYQQSTATSGGSGLNPIPGWAAVRGQKLFCDRCHKVCYTDGSDPPLPDGMRPDLNVCRRCDNAPRDQCYYHIGGSKGLRRR